MTKFPYYIRKSNLIIRNIGNKNIVIDPQNDNYYILSDAANYLLKTLYKKTSLTQLADKITSRYDINTISAQKDTESFIGNLLEKNLVRIINK